MTPPGTGQAEATQVAVLRAQQLALERQLLEVQQQQVAQLTSINSKLDMLNDVRTDLARIQQQQLSHHDSLARAHARLDGMSSQLSEHVTDSTAWRETVQMRLDARLAPYVAEQQMVAKQISNWRGMFVGVQSVMAFLMAIIMWLANGYIEKLDNLESRTSRIERVQDKAIPATITEEKK